ncbi:MAG: cobyrinate a,c-diamide synthase [Pseudomonadota bacterium]
MRGVLIAAPASGQGKTTVTLGLLRALRDQGVRVASGKSGPDYIDPAFHAAATGRPCVTLDAWAASASALRGRAAMQAIWEMPTQLAGGPATSPSFTELLVVEGAMGAFDGAVSRGGPGKGSAAELAAALGVPMVLVVDISHMAQSAGALVAGMAEWAREAGTDIAGVILNRVGSERHLGMARRAVSATCPVLGAIPRDPQLTVPSRHLGLLQAQEHGDLEALISRAAACVAENCDMDALRAIASPIDNGTSRSIPPLGQRIAVAFDTAFSFAYWHMLQDWRDQGAEILTFSPLANEAPDAADAVFLPGGYPELHAGQLATADRFMGGMRSAAGNGALIYGECGGYMVLGQALIDADGHRHRMLGLLDLETSFADRRLHLGYRQLTLNYGPWAGPVNAHEFHYAATVSAKGAPLGHAKDAAGTDLGPVGLIAGNVMGSFVHAIEMG